MPGSRRASRLPMNARRSNAASASETGVGSRCRPSAATCAGTPSTWRGTRQGGRRTEGHTRRGAARGQVECDVRARVARSHDQHPQPPERLRVAVLAGVQHAASEPLPARPIGHHRRARGATGCRVLGGCCGRDAAFTPGIEVRDSAGSRARSSLDSLGTRCNPGKCSWASLEVSQLLIAFSRP